MNKDNLAKLYESYIACLNRQDWAHLGDYVSQQVSHNGQVLGLRGYCEMLEKTFAAVPDLHFKVDLLAIDPPLITSRLAFDCVPTGDLLGFPVNGRRISFHENIFYEIVGGKIANAWSIIDTAAISAQL